MYILSSLNLQRLFIPGFGQKQPHSVPLISYGGFPRKHIKHNHMRHFWIKTFQCHDVMPFQFPGAGFLPCHSNHLSNRSCFPGQAIVSLISRINSLQSSSESSRSFFNKFSAVAFISWSRIYRQSMVISCTASYLWQPSSWNTILFSSSVNVIIYFLQSGLIACKYHMATYFCSPASLSFGKNFSRMSILSLDVYPHRIELSASIASRLLR